MKVLTSKKAIIAILSLGSVVLAGTIKDINSRTVSRKHALEELPVERSLASDVAPSMRIAIMKVEMSEAFKVNGKWEITRIVGSDEVVTYDKLNNPEDSKKNIVVPLKLVGTSSVMVNNDRDLVYKISLLSDFGTIAIFKKMGNGFEIIEARMIREKKAEVAVAEEVELVLERALNQSKSNKILSGSDISGEMTLTKKSIEGLSVSLTNTNGEVQSIDIASAQLLDGGSFKADVDGEEVSGVIFNNGKDGYRLSFVTGPLAGAMLNFVTAGELERIEQKDAEQNDNYFEQEEQKIQEMAQNEVVEERREMAENVENYEPVKILSADEIKETAETQGFNF
ncbi:hypothetical protein DOM21_00295 [Bacteriovorax stolpii]|uniref:Uncharacterized protein n=1 Tax=Bacteriovorax stolpii TaxID=960 RepID=A0A2K9NYN8_BACTC|nr:hypothetical protein [Bacteriovorax stolpii]AUO00086.1 hypothetical protein C0V70_18635 [Bacteriovorax stolpii]QDK39923.1 hypothetical protein DOM21_00295 [Bacteriovorax stolpii]TDP54021.1 hypothetical protein C8D79_1304 [Bacteriovorax stolpii]